MQLVIGLSFLGSALTGAYLLATDGSLWLLALSHAFGLVLIVSIDSLLGVMNLLSKKNVYIPSLAAALLGLLLQVGDIVTAPQYNMTMAYFASYLFGLGAYDLLLALQVAVVVVGLSGHGHAKFLARVRRGRGGKELSYTRRRFVASLAGFAVMIAAAVLVGSVKLPTPQRTQSTTAPAQSNLPAGAVADSSKMDVGSPVYFEYPSGYPNILMKQADGTLVALSLLCTHVCCECTYEASSNVIFCPCHGSVFAANGQVLRGPAPTPLPSIEFTVDAAGYVYPKGIKGSSPCISQA